MKKPAAARRAAKTSKEPACIVIHDLRQAIAALAAAVEAGKPVTLWSAEGAGIYAGAGWFAAVERRSRAAVPSAKASFVLDCAERPDMVQEAFRAGIRGARFSGPATVAAKLEDIAGKSRARLYRQRPRALDLYEASDPQNACFAYLSGD